MLSQAIAEGDSFLVIELSGEGSKRSQERQAGAQKCLAVVRVGQTTSDSHFALASVYIHHQAVILYRISIVICRS